MLRFLGRLIRLRRDTFGGIATEFAFAGPIMIVLSIGTVDIGRMVWINTTLSHAAHEGVRYASVRGAGATSPATKAEIIAFVKNRAAGILDAEMTVAVTWTPNNSSGSRITIALDYVFDSYIGAFLALKPVPLREEASMIVG
jgi:Flp pilus assembly protein TadG